MAQDFTAAKYIKIGWDTLHRDTVMLSHRLKAKGPFKGIIAVARGGLVPAAIVAREMDIRLVDTVCMVSYDEKVQRTGEVMVLKPVVNELSGAPPNEKFATVVPLPYCDTHRELLVAS